MDFFSSCSTQEEAKATFRTLSKHFHPDKGGDPKLMIELTNQFQKFPNKKTHNFNRINYSEERNRFSSFTQNSYLEIEIQELRLQMKGMTVTIIDLQREKMQFKAQLKEAANWGFVSRLCFFLFGVKYFNTFFDSNFNRQPHNTL